MKENSGQVISFMPKRAQNGLKNGQRVKNTLKTYILTEVITPGLDIKELAAELNVDARSVYRYLKTIKEVNSELFPESEEPDRP